MTDQRWVWILEIFQQAGTSTYVQDGAGLTSETNGRPAVLLLLSPLSVTFICANPICIEYVVSPNYCSKCCYQYLSSLLYSLT